MLYDRFTQGLNTIPLIAPVDTVATAIPTPLVKLGGAHGGTLFVQFGVITPATADANIVVTLQAATGAATTGAAAVAFDYRLSGAVGANTWGAITAATSTGATIASTDDGTMLAIDINPSKIWAAKNDATHVRAVITPDASYTVALVNAFVQLEPRYSQSTMVSAT